MNNKEKIRRFPPQDMIVRDYKLISEVTEEMCPVERKEPVFCKTKECSICRFAYPCEINSGWGDWRGEPACIGVKREPGEPVPEITGVSNKALAKANGKRRGQKNKNSIINKREVPKAVEMKERRERFHILFMQGLNKDEIMEKMKLNEAEYYYVRKLELAGAEKKNG